MPEQYKPPSLLGADIRPMTDTELGYLMQCSLAAPLRGVADQAFANELGFQGKVMFARCKYHGVDIERGLLAFLCVISNSPAKLVMWVWTLHNTEFNGVHTVEHWAMNLFPNGLPTEEAFQKAWDAQKSEKGGNLLDGDTVWKL